MGVDFDASHEVMDEIVGGGGGESEIVHDQSILFSEMRIDARYGVTDRISAELRLPIRFIDMGIVYRDLASGDPVTLVSADIHHRCADRL